MKCPKCGEIYEVYPGVVLPVKCHCGFAFVDIPEEDVAHQSHYEQSKIQPIDYIMANNLTFCEGSIVKYITRWRHKDGVKDLEKIKVCCDFLIREAQGLPPRAS